MRAKLFLAAALMALLTACGGKKTIDYGNGDTDIYTIEDNAVQMEFKQGDGTMATVPIKINKAIAAMVEGTADYKKWHKENGHDVYAYVVRNAKRASIDAKAKCAHPATFRLEKVGVAVDEGIMVLMFDYYAKNSFGVEDKASHYTKVFAYDDYRGLIE